MKYEIINISMFQEIRSLLYLIYVKGGNIMNIMKTMIIIVALAAC